MRRRLSIHFEYDRLRQVCSAAGLDLLSSVVGIIRLVNRGVSALNDRPAVDPSLGALGATLATRLERVSRLESQVAFTDTEIAAKMTKFLTLEGCVKMAEGGVSIMSAVIRELKLKLVET